MLNYVLLSLDAPELKEFTTSQDMPEF